MRVKANHNNVFCLKMRLPHVKSFYEFNINHIKVVEYPPQSVKRVGFKILFHSITTTMFYTYLIV